MAINYSSIAEKHRQYYGEGDSHLRIYHRLYADRTHFLYELIQNADDAISKDIKPSKLIIDIHHGELLAANDGRVFTEADVEAICSIGQSSKDLTQTGAFGIGFKAVYSYTDSPEIYSGEERFRISRLVVPEPVTDIPPRVQTLLESARTVFRLTFKNELSAESLDQLTKRIRELHPWTLLFLRHLKSVEWSTDEGKEFGSYTCERDPYKATPDTRLVTLKTSVEGANLSVQQFLTFRKEIKPPPEVISRILIQAGDDEERKRILSSAERNQQIEIAFKHDGGHIVQVEKGVLFAYLPTEKETHLRFLFQARYQTTPARDNIPDANNSAWNGWLIEETASYIPDVLVALKREGYVEPEFFNVLPHAEDQIPDMFRRISNSLTQELRTGEYIPIDGGSYRRPDQVLFPDDPDLRALLDRQQLIHLTGAAGAAWLHRRFMENSRGFDIALELGVSRIDAPRFVDWLELQTKEWLERKNENWLRKLYSYLGRQMNERERLKNIPLLRLQNGSHVSINGTRAIFLPPVQTAEYKDVALLIGELPIIRSSLLKGNLKIQIRAFLEELGVKLLRPAELISKWLLPQYRVAEEHLTNKKIKANRIHVQYIFSSLDKLSLEQRQKLLLTINKVPLLLSKKKNGDQQVSFIAPENAYLPSDYTGNDDLETFFSTTAVWFVSEKYLTGNTERAKWASFMRALGCHDLPRLTVVPLAYDRKREIRGGIWSVPEDSHKEDLNWEGLESFLKQAYSLDKAKCLWRLLERVFSKENFRRTYYWNVRRQSTWKYNKEYYAKPFVLLRRTPWLPDEKDIPHRPEELFGIENRRLLEDSVLYLHPDFDLKEGRNIKNRQLAQELGVHVQASSADVVNCLKRLSGHNIPLKRTESLYQFLDSSHARPLEDFFQHELLLAPSQKKNWWKSNEIYWENEGALFGDSRGYLKKYYPEKLKSLFIAVGVASNAEPVDYVSALLEIPGEEAGKHEITQRLNTVLHRLWGAVQEGHSVTNSSEWQRALTGKCWPGIIENRLDYFNLDQLLWNDHPHIAQLFEGKLPFWCFPQLNEFRKHLGVQSCSEANVQFNHDGEQHKDEESTRELQEKIPYIRDFLESEKWKGERHESRPLATLYSLYVCLVEKTNVMYELKGVLAQATEACPGYVDESGSIWVTVDADKREYPEIIGDALQEHFGVKELREFVKDLLTRPLDLVLSTWRKRGLQSGSRVIEVTHDVTIELESEHEAVEKYDPRAETDVDEARNAQGDTDSQHVVSLIDQSLTAQLNNSGVTQTQQSSSNIQNYSGASGGTTLTKATGFSLPPIESVTATQLDTSDLWTPTPRSSSSGYSYSWYAPSLQDKERDRIIGARGEEIVYALQLERVKALNLPKARVIWESKRNPGASFDIISVDDDGEDLWIEVKATTGKSGRFEWSIAELQVAMEKRNQYELWRVYEADTLTPSYKRFRDPIGLLLQKLMKLDVASLYAEVEPLNV